jgi:thiamine-phosphate pyrophosphorylase
MLISDRRLAPAPRLAEVAAAAAAAGPLAVQIREKDATATVLLEIVRTVQEALARADPPHPVRLLVNGRFDVALAAGADGVHLPADGPPADRVREAAGGRLRIGVSTHSVEEVRDAVAGGADYVVFGPVFDTPSKRGVGRPQGLEALARAARAAGSVPLLAVGGIDSSNAGRCAAAGAHGAAVIRAILEAEDPAAEARAIHAALDAARAGRPAPEPAG